MFNTKILSEVEAVGSRHFPRDSNSKLIQYGTAGFREKAGDLNHVLYRMGILAAIRSCDAKGTIGIMVTASHNPLPDNGVKLVDPSGEMLAPEWERIATQLANANDTELKNCLRDIVGRYPPKGLEPPFVFIGMDTRPSSVKLVEAAKKGAQLMGAKVKDFGLVTTPELHFLVASRNAGGDKGIPTEEGYLNSLAGPFMQLRDGEIASKGNYTPEIDLDAANGVGAQKMKLVCEKIGSALTVNFFNDGDGVLNFECGADFVKVSQCAPKGLEKTKNRGVSFDGDADRIIYFYTDHLEQFHMLDGDKIATLVAGYLQELLLASGCDLKLGIVQTAYANGASTDYISEQLNIPVACVPTGVKHLHHRAAQFDIGVYFEANGHGTVLFNKNAREQFSDETLTGDRLKATKRLLALSRLINQSTGDAISDLLLVETILHAKGWSASDWDKMYTDLPNRQLKVMVKDRNLISTTDAERRVSSPPNIQGWIDEMVKSTTRGRAFIRPSGTENVVRVYAEAATQEQADKLAKQVAELTHHNAGGSDPFWGKSDDKL